MVFEVALPAYNLHFSSLFIFRLNEPTPVENWSDYTFLGEALSCLQRTQQLTWAMWQSIISSSELPHIIFFFLYH